MTEIKEKEDVAMDPEDINVEIDDCPFDVDEVINETPEQSEMPTEISEEDKPEQDKLQEDKTAEQDKPEQDKLEDVFSQENTTKLPKDKPTPKESEELSENDLKEVVDTKTKDLYQQLKEFVENTTKYSENTGIINTCPTGIDVLDAVLGGGFALGKFNCVVGRPGCGKTMLAIQTIANAQKQFDSPLILYLDSEESTTTYRLKSLGVDNPPITPYSSLTVEKVFQLIEALCLFKHENKITEPSFIVWDSIANTLSEKEMKADDPNSVIGYKARLFSILIPKYVEKCSQYNICILSVNQLRDNLQIGPYGAAPELKFLSYDKSMPGGSTLKFNIFHLLELKVRSIIKEEQYGFPGVHCEIKCVKNKLFPPNIPCDLVGSFVTGFDNFYTNYMFLAKNKFMQRGAWNYLKSYPTKKFRTKDAKNIYLTDKDFKKAFDEAVQECIQKIIKDPYEL